MISYPTAVVLLIVSIVFLAVSQLLAKSRLSDLLGQQSSHEWGALLLEVIKDPPMWGVGLLLVLGAASWYAAMVRLPVSIMLPLAGSVSPLVAIGAHFLLGEVLTGPKLAAIGLISVGVAWLAFQTTP